MLKENELALAFNLDLGFSSSLAVSLTGSSEVVSVDGLSSADCVTCFAGTSVFDSAALAVRAGVVIVGVALFAFLRVAGGSVFFLASTTACGTTAACGSAFLLAAAA